MNSEANLIASAEDPIGSTNEESVKKYFLIIFIFLCFFFFFMAGVVEKYHPKYGHETGMTVLLGIVFSLIIYAFEGNKVEHTFKFSPYLFFNFFLPPIIFNSGFNMHKKKFFENLGNVGLFGVFVTIVCFALYSILSVVLLKSFDITMVNQYALNHNIDTPGELNPQVIDLPIMQILLFTSLLCSSDVVAAVSIVDYNKQPKLYSCVFGEGCLNDIVSIILFNTVVQLQTVEF